MNDQWTWTMGWGWTVGTQDRVGQRRAKGENWDNYNRIKKNKSKN